MVDWQPLMGVLPPLSLQQWQYAFDQYKQFPEYKLVNATVAPGYFRFIYLMEYGHRLLGRIIGLVFFVPLIYFSLRGNLPGALKIRLFGLFILGAVQGGLGWYMVKSGLVDNPAVSQYRLTLHLLVAVLIYGYLLRCIVGLTQKPAADFIENCRPWGVAVLVMVFVMIGSGGFMAGTHAGFIFNTFPTMEGVWMPDQIWSMQPVWLNIFENPVAIQFFHRGLALIISITVLLMAIKMFSSADRGSALIPVILLFCLVLQIGLGISTLVLRVPVALGVAHQAGALILFGFLCHLFAKPFHFIRP